MAKQSMIHELSRLREAVLALIKAGPWVKAQSKDQKAEAKLWKATREALHLPGE